MSNAVKKQVDAITARHRRKKAKGICVRAGCTRPIQPKCRDNCKECYNALDGQRRKLKSAEARKRFDETQVALGHISPPRRGRKKSKKNPYREVA